MKNSIFNLIQVSLFISCTTQVALWCSEEEKKEKPKSFYPQITSTYLTPPDIFSPEKPKEKPCLLYEKFQNSTTKPVPGFISPIASPNPSPPPSPEKAKTVARKAAPFSISRRRLFEDNIDNSTVFDTETFAANSTTTAGGTTACSTSTSLTFGYFPDNKNIQKSIHGKSIFSASMPPEEQNTLSCWIEKNNMNSSSLKDVAHNSKLSDKNDWWDKYLINEMIQHLSRFQHISREAKSHFRVFNKVYIFWSDVRSILKSHLEEICSSEEKYKTVELGLLLCQYEFDSFKDLANKFADAEKRFIFAYENAKIQDPKALSRKPLTE